MTDPNLKARLRPVIRVFVSSTFSDMGLERNALQEHVYPNLEKLCLQNGFQFQAIDLRWGVSSEAGLDHRTMRICFEELRRSQEVSPEPNFLILLGNRYGWRPLPEEISQAEFEKLVAAAEAGREGQPLIPGTHGKIARQVLGEWYRCDENVLLPSPPETAPDRAPLNYILQPRTRDLGDGRDYTRTKDEPPKDTQDWLDVQQFLWRIINVAFPAELLDQRFEHIDWSQHVADVCDRQHPKRAVPQVVRFQASATEQEIWCGALSAVNAERHVLAFFRDITNRDKYAPDEVKDFFDQTEAGAFDETSATRQAALKAAIRERLGKDAPVPIPFSRLKAENGKVVVAAEKEEIDKFCESVETPLRSIIECQIEQYWHETTQASAERALRELEIEQQEHARVSQERGGAETFVGREDKLEAIREYLCGEAAWPLVVYGASGCGKTALLARAAQEAAALKPVVRLIGIHPRSSDLRGLLSSLCQELRLRYPRENELPTDIKLLEVELHEQFRDAAKSEQPLILFLDALDQLADTDGGRLLHWMPVGPLPAHLKLVVSCLSGRPEGDPAGQPYAELRRRQLPAENLINLEAFLEDEARKLLFYRWLPQAGRTVSPIQRARIEQRLASEKCRQPIYLKLLFEEARLWRFYGDDNDAPELGGDVPALLGQLFDRLSQPENHGHLLVERVLGYLAASREGLAENEILEILFRDPGYKKALDQATETNRHEMPPNATRIPIAIWSRLRFDLASYLTERAATGANVLTFYHRQVAEWIQNHSAEESDQGWKPHPLLADYFQKLADPEKNQSWKGDSPRPFLQVVFHLAGAQRFDELCQALCDLLFVEARCRHGQVFDLIADYRLAQEHLPEAQADLREERARDERVRRWTVEIIAYAKAWSKLREKKHYSALQWFRPKPHLPEPVPTCEMWTEEKIQAECERIIQTPTRRDQLEAFVGFVSGQCYPLLEHGQYPGFVLQHACNHEPAGPVHDAAAAFQHSLRVPHVLRRWPADARYNPKPALLRTMEGHSGGIGSVSVTPDGRRAVSAGGVGDQTLRVWDMENGQCLSRLQGHSAPVNCVIVTPDGRRAVSGSEDNSMRVWDLENGTCLCTFQGHSGGIGSVSVTPDGRRAVSAGGVGDQTLRVWDMENGKCLRTLQGRTNWVICVSMTPDGRRVISAGDDAALRVWDLESGVCLRTLEGHKWGVTTVSVTPDGRRAISGGADHAVRVWDLDRGVCLHTLEGHGAIVEGVSVTPDGRRAVSGGGHGDNTLRVWDLENGQCLRTLKGHSSGGGCVSVTPDGQRAVTGGHVGRLRVWDLRSGACLLTMKSHSYWVSGVSVMPDGRRAVSGGGHGDNTLRVWDLESGQCQRTLEGHSDGVCSVSVTSAGGRAVSASMDTTLRVWDLDSGACLTALEGKAGMVLTVSVTPDGRLAVSGGVVGALRVWDLESGQCLRMLEGHSGSVECVRVTPDGRRAVSCGKDGTLRVWDLESGACLHTLPGHPPRWPRDMVKSVSVTPDGRRAVSGATHDNAMKVWDLESGVLLRTLVAHSTGVECVSVTPDGWRGLSGSSRGMTPDGLRAISSRTDTVLRVWDLESGACLHTLAGHLGGVETTSVTPDGRRAVSAGTHDNTLRVWDTESGQCLGVYHGSSPFHSVALQGIGNVICAGTDTGEVLFLELHRVPSGPAILTAANPQQARCPVCGQEFAPPPAVVAAIQNPQLEIGNRQSAIPSSCPHCQHPLQFNPFFAAATDYAEVLRRGLEFSRRERGAEHAETLAHLAALAVYLENAGNPEEAAEFKREHDEIAARVKGKK